jgi:hypothetical protein
MMKKCFTASFVLFFKVSNRNSKNEAKLFFRNKRKNNEKVQNIGHLRIGHHAPNHAHDNSRYNTVILRSAVFGGERPNQTMHAAATTCHVFQTIFAATQPVSGFLRHAPKYT